MPNKIEEQYIALLNEILEDGVVKGDRTGTGTRSLFGRQIRHNMKDGFPLLTTKRVAVKTMMTELKWFLKGDTNIKYLVDNGCNIWNGDAYKQYSTYAGNLEEPDYNVHVEDVQENRVRILTEKEFVERIKIDCYCGHTDTCDCGPLLQEEFINKIKTDGGFAEKWGELGPIYGKQWRSWSPVAGEINKGGKDQIKELIKNLKENPDSRRLMVSAWNVGELSEMTLPPCHYGFQVYTRELSDEERYNYWFKNNYETGMERYFDPNNLPDFDDDYYTATPTRSISLMWNQRSVDTFLGLPFNISSYAALLCLIAEEVGMAAGELVGNLGDTHLYSNHLEQAKEQVSREIYDLPTVEFSNINILDGEFDYDVKDYKYHPSIKAPLSN